MLPMHCQSLSYETKGMPLIYDVGKESFNKYRITFDGSFVFYTKTVKDRETPLSTEWFTWEVSQLFSSFWFNHNALGFWYRKINPRYVDG